MINQKIKNQGYSEIIICTVCKGYKKVQEKKMKSGPKRILVLDEIIHVECKACQGKGMLKKTTNISYKPH